MTTFELVPAGPFSLEAGAAFLAGFAPAAYRGAGDGPTPGPCGSRWR
jgi:hypothetical protein